MQRWGWARAGAGVGMKLFIFWSRRGRLVGAFMVIPSRPIQGQETACRGREPVKSAEDPGWELGGEPESSVRLGKWPRKRQRIANGGHTSRLRLREDGAIN